MLLFVTARDLVSQKADVLQGCLCSVESAGLGHGPGEFFDFSDFVVGRTDSFDAEVVSQEGDLSLEEFTFFEGDLESILVQEGEDGLESVLSGILSSLFLHFGFPLRLTCLFQKVGTSSDHVGRSPIVAHACFGKCLLDSDFLLTHTTWFLLHGHTSLLCIGRRLQDD